MADDCRQQSTMKGTGDAEWENTLSEFRVCCDRPLKL